MKREQSYNGYAPTDVVYILATMQAATVIAVIITRNRFMYEVRYWLDGESITVTLEEFELTDEKPSMSMERGYG